MTDRQTTTTPGDSRPARPRDAGASRAALLEAAQELFGKLGFEGTTVREIGDRAGVDAALIARYFGSKADLYIAAVAAERMGDQEVVAYDGLDQMAATLMERVDRHGPGPILQALVRADTTDEIRDAARSRLARRLVEPLAAGLADQGSDRPQLRAEVAVSALIGVALSRSLGWFTEMGTAPTEELVELFVDAIADKSDATRRANGRG